MERTLSQQNVSPICGANPPDCTSCAVLLRITSFARLKPCCASDGPTRGSPPNSASLRHRQLHSPPPRAKQNQRYQPPLTATPLRARHRKPDKMIYRDIKKLGRFKALGIRSPDGTPTCTEAVAQDGNTESFTRLSGVSYVFDCLHNRLSPGGCRLLSDISRSGLNRGNLIDFNVGICNVVQSVEICITWVLRYKSRWGTMGSVGLV